VSGSCSARHRSPAWSPPRNHLLPWSSRHGTEVYADDAAFAAHSASEAHAAASPVFTELIAAADVLIGETLIAIGLGG
jgi:hypothetical protein